MKSADRAPCASPNRFWRIAAVWGCLAAFSCGLAMAENWPQFRGADGTGISSEKGVPNSWSQGDYLWDVAIDGIGHASPVVWGNDVFVSARNRR